MKKKRKGEGNRKPKTNPTQTAQSFSESSPRSLSPLSAHPLRSAQLLPSLPHAFRGPFSPLHSARAARVHPRTTPARPTRQPARRLAPLQPLARLPASASPHPADSVAPLVSASARPERPAPHALHPLTTRAQLQHRLPRATEAEIPGHNRAGLPTTGAHAKALRRATNRSPCLPSSSYPLHGRRKP